MPKVAETEFEKMLQKGLKQKPQQKGEDRAAYVKRITAALFKLPDEKQDKVYEKMGEAGQLWWNTAVTAIKAKKALPDFAAKLKKPKAEEETETDTDTETDIAGDTGDPFGEDESADTDTETEGDTDTADSEDAGETGNDADSGESEDDPFGDDESADTDIETEDDTADNDSGDGAEDFADDDTPAEPEPPKRQKVAAGKGQAKAAPADSAADDKKKKAACKAMREMLIVKHAKVLPACATAAGAKKVFETCKTKLEAAGHTFNPVDAVNTFYSTVAVLQALVEKDMLQTPE